MVFRVHLEAHFESYLVDLKAPVCTSRYLHSLHLTTYILNIKYQVRFRFQDLWLENFIYLMIKIPSKISYLILTTTQYIQMASISWYYTCLRRKWFCHIFIQWNKIIYIKWTDQVVVWVFYDLCGSIRHISIFSLSLGPLNMPSWIQ